MKIKLLTTDTTLPNWKSLKAKHREILKALNASPSANFTAIDVELRLDLAKPEVAARGAIEHKWLDKIFLPYFNQGYDFTGLHFSMDGWTKAGIRPTLNGANPIDTDQIGEFYLRSDEDTTKRYVTGGSRLNKYIQTVLHEMIHEYYRGAGLPDITHQHHYSMGDIRMLAATLDWTLYRPGLQIQRKQETIIELLQRKVIELLKKRVAQLTDLLSAKATNQLRPKVQRAADAVVAEMKRHGHPVRIVEGFRTLERQTELYNQGRTTPGAVVTNAKAGQSLHNYGVAVDFVFRREGYNASDTLWALLGDVGKKQGFEWGGDWNGFVDRPHFEMKLGYSLRDFKSNKVNWNKYQQIGVVDNSV